MPRSLEGRKSSAHLASSRTPSPPRLLERFTHLSGTGGEGAQRGNGQGKHTNTTEKEKYDLRPSAEEALPECPQMGLLN